MRLMLIDVAHAHETRRPAAGGGKARRIVFVFIWVRYTESSINAESAIVI